MLFPLGENRGLLIHPEVSYKTFPMGYSSRSNPFTTCTTASCSSGLQVASRTFSSTSRGAPPESGIRASVTGRRSSAPTCSSTASSFDFEMPTTRVSSVPIGCACGVSARHWYKRLAPPAHAASKMMVWPSDVKRAAPTLPEPKVMRSKVAGVCLGIWSHKNHIAAAPATDGDQRNRAHVFECRSGCRTSAGGRNIGEAGKVEGHIARGLKAFRRVFLETMMHDAIERRRNRAQRLGQRRRFFFQDRAHHFDRAIAGERAFAAQHFVENRAKAKNIRTLIRHLPAHLLRRHVAHGAEDHTGLRGGGPRQSFVSVFRLRRGQFGQAKIQNFYVAVAGDENIFGLQVAMDDSFVVRGGQGLWRFAPRIPWLCASIMRPPAGARAKIRHPEIP